MEHTHRETDDLAVDIGIPCSCTHKDGWMDGWAHRQGHCKHLATGLIFFLLPTAALFATDVVATSVVYHTYPWDVRVHLRRDVDVVVVPLHHIRIHTHPSTTRTWKASSTRHTSRRPIPSTPCSPRRTRHVRRAQPRRHHDRLQASHVRVGDVAPSTRHAALA